ARLVEGGTFERMGNQGRVEASYLLEAGRGDAPQVSVGPPAPHVRERINWVDYVLVALAIVSLGLVIAQEVAPTYLRREPEVLRWLLVGDMAICGVFALEFLWRMRGQPSKWAYTKSRWYDVLGMIPVSH